MKAKIYSYAFVLLLLSIASIVIFGRTIQSQTSELNDKFNERVHHDTIELMERLSLTNDQEQDLRSILTFQKQNVSSYISGVSQSIVSSFSNMLIIHIGVLSTLIIILIEKKTTSRSDSH